MSSAINFSGGDGPDKFIATIIAFRCLSYNQTGILDTLVPNNTELVGNSNISNDNKVIQTGNRLKFSGPEPQDNLAIDRGGGGVSSPVTQQ